EIAVRAHRFEFSDGVADFDRTDLQSGERNHFSEVTRRDEFNRGCAKYRTKRAIKRGGRSAALKMTEHANAGFFAGALLEPRANNGAYRTEARLADFGVRGRSHKPAALLSHTFCNDDDCELFPEVFALLDFFANAFVREGNLGNRRKGVWRA